MANFDTINGKIVNKDDYTNFNGVWVETNKNQNTATANNTTPARQAAISSGDPNMILAEVLQGYWSDYETKGLPLFDQLVNETTYGLNGQAVVDREVNAGIARTNTAINVTGQNQQEQLRGYGISLTPEQQADNDRLKTLGRSTALVDSANRITQNLVDRNRAIATGSSTSNIYRQQTQGG